MSVLSRFAVVLQLLYYSVNTARQPMTDPFGDGPLDHRFAIGRQ